MWVGGWWLQLLYSRLVDHHELLIDSGEYDAIVDGLAARLNGPGDSLNGINATSAAVHVGPFP